MHNFESAIVINPDFHCAMTMLKTVLDRRSGIDVAIVRNSEMLSLARASLPELEQSAKDLDAKLGVARAMVDIDPEQARDLAKLEKTAPKAVEAAMEKAAEIRRLEASRPALFDEARKTDEAIQRAKVGFDVELRSFRDALLRVVAAEFREVVRPLIGLLAIARTFDQAIPCGFFPERFDTMNVVDPESAKVIYTDNARNFATGVDLLRPSNQDARVSAEDNAVTETRTSIEHSLKDLTQLGTMLKRYRAFQPPAAERLKEPPHVWPRSNNALPANQRQPGPNSDWTPSKGTFHPPHSEVRQPGTRPTGFRTQVAQSFHAVSGDEFDAVRNDANAL